MPRESEAATPKRAAGSRSERETSRSGWGVLELTEELRAQLLPWIDLAEIGPAGLQSWLVSILPLIPRTSAGDHVLDRDASHVELEERLSTLAHALADCASDRARKNFQASEYFRENRALARRLKALEAMLRTRMATGKIERADLADAESEAAVRRYVPP
jgi:hypothetical protein